MVDKRGELRLCWRQISNLNASVTKKKKDSSSEYKKETKYPP